MKVQGNVTTFDHVRGFQPSHPPALLLMVVFDGEPDYWEIREGSSLAEAKGELEIYYRRDWAGTGRVLPIHVLVPRPDLGGVINCV